MPEPQRRIASSKGVTALRNPYREGVAGASNGSQGSTDVVLPFARGHCREA